MRNEMAKPRNAHQAEKRKQKTARRAGERSRGASTSPTPDSSDPRNSEGSPSSPTQDGATSKPPRRHHLVPKFYLRRFARNEQIRVRSRDLTKSFINSISDASVRTHYYSVELSDGTRSPQVEQALAKVEGAANKIILGMDEGRLPTGEDKKTFSFFLALQMTRTQAQRNSLDSKGTAVIRRLMQIAPIDLATDVFREKHKRAPNTEELKESRDRIRKAADATTLSYTSNAHIETMIESAKYLAPFLARRAWCLMDFDRPLLLTSDSPVLPYSPPSELGFWGVGVANARFVCYPLDPRCALFMFNTESSAQTIQLPRMHGSEEEARGMNFDIAFQAEEWIFQHPDLSHDEIANLPPAEVDIK